MDAPTLQFTTADVFDLTLSRSALESQVLPGYVSARRWFGGKARNPRAFEIIDLVPLEITGAVATCCLALVRVTYADRKSETYSLPLAIVPAVSSGDAIVANLADGSVVVEAMTCDSFRSTLLRLMASGQQVDGTSGSIVGVPGSMLGDGTEDFSSRVLAVEQSNSSMIFADPSGTDRLFVKVFRKLEEGMNPDVEITRFLSEKQHFAHVPAYGGSLEYRRDGDAEPQVVALALGMVPNDGDAWAFTLGEVETYYSSIRKNGNPAPTFSVPGLLDASETPGKLTELLGTYVARAWQLGTRSGQLHLALADSNEPAFAPEPLTSHDLHALAAEIRESAQRAWGLLASPASRDAAPRNLLADLQSIEQEISRRADALANASITAVRTRTHGDYHLGQVLNTGDDFVIIDFEGEPLRPLAERKTKRSPLRDVAGMLRSFHYAAHSGLTDAPDARELLPWAEVWAQAISRIFLRGWLEIVGSAPFVPPDRHQLQTLLDAFLLEKALYEVAYELNNRPSWVSIPLRGIESVLRSGTHI